ncbi:MAG: cation acetate symporter [Candidatus Omnitrophica bacterium]|nr:cation acetate symporter [Candidatus Omnitrophota bacterium]
MASTTYVQFLKGGLLIIFSTVLVVAVCVRGFNTRPDQGGRVPFYDYKTLAVQKSGENLIVSEPGWKVVETHEVKAAHATFALLANAEKETWWLLQEVDGALTLKETQSVAETSSGQKIINGSPASETNILRQVGNIELLKGQKTATRGSVSPFGMLAAMADKDTVVRRWKDAKLEGNDGSKVTVYFPTLTHGNQLMRPGLKFKVQGTPLQKIDFVSLMLALFLGTASLPHILIRYYTVSSPASARKSTIVAIAGIGFFYILTLFMGLGAMTGGVLNPADSNMAAPLLARSFGNALFAFISAIAFATVLGTVSGLIVAASGAVAHDFFDRFLNLRMDDRHKIRAGKISAFAVGALAIVLGILFKGMNVTFLVGLAFAVAASANLPAILMLLFWKRTTAAGITASVFTGIGSSLGLIALSPDLYKLYGLDPALAPIPFTNPGIISIPLSFIVLIVVSLLTKKKPAAAA